MKQNNREVYLDIVKGIGILLVVIGHLQLDNVIRNFIYSFHMPLFFYVGGALYMYKSTVPWNKIRYFLSLYLFFGTLFILLISLKEHTFDLTLVYKLIQSNPVSIYDIQWFGVFWFLLAYGIVLLLANIKIFSYLSISLLLFIVLYFTQDTAIFENILYLPLCIAPALILLFFFNLGKANNFIMTYFSSKNMWILITSFIVLNILNIYTYNGFESKIINYGVLHFEPNLILVLLVGIVGIFTTLYISKYIELNTFKLSSILQYFGKNSLFIFIWHMFILALVHSILNKIIGGQEYELTYLFQGVKFTISIFLLLIAIYVYDKVLVKVKSR
jgi:fucose 4-O-acetylase-like acetyltransferase